MPRFLMYEIDDKAVATNTPPSPELMAEMGKLIEETTKSGILVATGGLGPNSTHVRTSGTKAWSPRLRRVSSGARATPGPPSATCAAA